MGGEDAPEVGSSISGAMLQLVFNRVPFPHLPVSTKGAVVIQDDDESIVMGIYC